MPMRLEGSCRCGAISFSVDSNTPYPYQRCYCSICRKSAGSGGYAINIMGRAETSGSKANARSGCGMRRSTAIRARPTGITASAAAPRSGSATSNGLSWCTRLPRRLIRSYPRRLRACISCCATKRAGSHRKSAPMTTVLTDTPNCRLRIGTRNTGCGLNEPALLRLTEASDPTRSFAGRRWNERKPRR